jgi:hypothetical protein
MANKKFINVPEKQADAPKPVLTEEQYMILEHALGYNYNPRHDRAHYVDDPFQPGLVEMAELGLFEKGPLINQGTSQYFMVTDKGTETFLADREIINDTKSAKPLPNVVKNKRRSPRSKIEMNRDDVAMKNLHDGGQSIQQIADTLNLHYATVQIALKNLGCFDDENKEAQPEELPHQAELPWWQQEKEEAAA